jgi:hypothetical protein
MLKRKTQFKWQLSFNSSKGSEEDLNCLGFFLGAGAQSNADQDPEVSPPQSDLVTAEHLGERVVKVTMPMSRRCHGDGRYVLPCLANAGWHVFDLPGTHHEGHVSSSYCEEN